MRHPRNGDVSENVKCQSTSGLVKQACAPRDQILMVIISSSSTFFYWNADIFPVSVHSRAVWWKI